MQTNTDTRRSALKKLGITSGAAWIAPTVATLVVPKHATATSSSSSSSSSGGLTAPNSADVSASMSGPSGVQQGLTILITSATDYSAQTISNLLVGGVSASMPQASRFSRGITTIFVMAANNVSTGDTWSFSLLGASYSGTL